MLQWMGGSRRKVTTSQKSTQNRQKLYFERWKRQQQQWTAKFESFNDEGKKNGPYKNQQRSLDVLSLLNFSTESPECKTSCQGDGKEHLEIAASRGAHHTMKSPVTIRNSMTSVDHSLNKEKGNSSSYRVVPAPKKGFHSIPDDQDHNFNGNDSKERFLTEIYSQRLSVFDLVGYDGPTANLEGTSASEAHVAFSVEGLGKVDKCTPVQSPSQPDRSSPLKSTRQPDSLDDYKCKSVSKLEQDATLQTSNMLPASSPLRFPIGLGKAYTKREPRSSFCDVSIIDTSRDRNSHLWHGFSDRSSFLDEHLYNEEEDGLPWKDWPAWQTEDFSAGSLKYQSSNASWCENHVMANMLPDAFDSSLQVHKGTSFSYDCWSPNTGTEFDLGDVSNHPASLGFVAEDKGDSLSLRSEESCSSSAAVAEETSHSMLNSMTRKRRRHLDSFFSSRNKHDLKKIFAKEVWCEDKTSISASFPRKSDPLFYACSPCKTKPGPPLRWFPELEGASSPNTDLGFGSYFGDSEMRLELPGDEVFGAFPVREFPLDTNLLLGKSTYAEFVEYPTFPGWTGRKLVSSPPVEGMNFLDDLDIHAGSHRET